MTIDYVNDLYNLLQNCVILMKVACGQTWHLPLSDIFSGDCKVVDPAKPQDLFDLPVFSFVAVTNPAHQIRHYAMAGQMASTSVTFFQGDSTFATVKLEVSCTVRVLLCWW